MEAEKNFTPAGNWRLAQVIRDFLIIVCLLIINYLPSSMYKLNDIITSCGVECFFIWISLLSHTPFT